MSVDRKLEFCDFIKDWKEEFDCFLVDDCYPTVELFGEEYSIATVMQRGYNIRYECFT